MHVIMGATGHVGGATAEALFRRGEPVLVVTRDPDAGARWRARGAEVAIADAADADALRAAFQRGRRALLVNPPADPSGDTDAAENATVDAILDALDGAGLEKVVAVSTYGVQPGERIGDLGTLWRLEQGLAARPIPAAINRHAYSMTNLDGVVATVRDTGEYPSMLPADLLLPMVAPADLGEAAAERLVSSLDDVGVWHVEGPERSTTADVAAALAAMLGRPVVVRETPPDSLETVFASLGFSPEAAASYAGMTRLTAAGPDLPADPWQGRVTLAEHLQRVVDALLPASTRDASTE